MPDDEKSVAIIERIDEYFALGIATVLISPMRNDWHARQRQRRR